MEGSGVASSTEYDDDLVPVNHRAFRRLISPQAEVRKLAGGFIFVEGPVWIPGDPGYLIFSDVRADRMLRWDSVNGIRTYREPSGRANGNILGPGGSLITAQENGVVTRTREDGGLDTLVQRYQEDRLNSPNDLDVHSDGTIWFTDPTHGLGDRAKEVPGNYVYRFDPDDSSLEAMITDVAQPNGLCFSADERTLYVVSTGPTPETRNILAYSLDADGDVSGGQVFAVPDAGIADGLACDELGNVWSSAGDGVQIFSSSGELVGRILLPEMGANLAFGGADGTTLYITARTSLYSVPTLVHDAKFGRG